MVVPGLTLDLAKLKALAEFVKGFACVERVELLPFNKLGEYKWRELGLDYTLEAVPSPTSEQMAEARALFARAPAQS